MKAFIVEGHMEQRIVQKLCPRVPVRRMRTNGDHVAISVIAREVNIAAQTLENRNFPIVVIFDREKRDKSCAEIIEELERELQKLEVDVSQFRFVVADRTSESWFLPFMQSDCTITPNEVQTAGVEGNDCKGTVKQLFRARGFPYIETVNGVELFCSLNPGLTATISPSFKRLVESLDPSCWWLRTSQSNVV